MKHKLFYIYVNIYVIYIYMLLYLYIRVCVCTMQNKWYMYLTPVCQIRVLFQLCLSCVAVLRLLPAPRQTLSLCVGHQWAQCPGSVPRDSDPKDTRDMHGTCLPSVPQDPVSCCMTGHVLWQREVEGKFAQRHFPNLFPGIQQIKDFS